MKIMLKKTIILTIFVLLLTSCYNNSKSWENQEKNLETSKQNTTLETNNENIIMEVMENIDDTTPLIDYLLRKRHYRTIGQTERS